MMMPKTKKEEAIYSWIGLERGIPIYIYRAKKVGRNVGTYIEELLRAGQQ